MNLEKYLKKVLQNIKIVIVERQLQLSKEIMVGELEKKEESGKNIIKNNLNLNNSWFWKDIYHNLIHNIFKNWAQSQCIRK